MAVLILIDHRAAGPGIELTAGFLFKHPTLSPLLMLAALAAQWISGFVDSKSFYEHVNDI